MKSTLIIYYLPWALIISWEPSSPPLPKISMKIWMTSLPSNPPAKNSTLNLPTSSSSALLLYSCLPSLASSSTFSWPSSDSSTPPTCPSRYKFTYQGHQQWIRVEVKVLADLLDRVRVFHSLRQDPGRDPVLPARLLLPEVHILHLDVLPPHQRCEDDLRKLPQTPTLKIQRASW